MTTALALSCTRQDAAAHFQRDGFAVISSLFGVQEIQALRQELDRYISRELPRLPADAAFYEDKADPGTLFRLEKLSWYNPVMRDLLWGDKLMSLAGDVLGDEPVPQNMMLFAKPARVGSPTPPHQDSYYWMIDPIDAGTTFWLPLEAVDEANGCVRYVPGSHKLGMRPHGPSKQFGFSLGLLDFGDDDLRQEVAAPVQVGDMIAHSGLCIHRADANRSQRGRWALGMVYYGKRARYDEERKKAYAAKLKAEWEAANKL